MFQAYGKIPTTLIEVTERGKDIRYASCALATTEEHLEMHSMLLAMNALIKTPPPDLRDSPQTHKFYELGCGTERDIVQLIYRPFLPQGASKDYQFSREMMEMRWRQKMADAVETLYGPQ